MAQDLCLKLVILEEGNRSELELEQGVTSVGRAIDNRIRLNDTLASRHHCRLELDEEGLWVADLGSSNGTAVNGQRVTRSPLAVGDRIGVGKVILEVVGAGEARPAPLPDETQAIGILAGGVGAGEKEPGYRTMTDEAHAERDNLRVFARITRQLSRETELVPLLRQIVDSAVALVGGERGFLLMGDGAEGEAPDVDAMRVRVARNFDCSDIAVPHSRLSMGIARRVIETGEAILTVDASADARFDGMASVEELRLRSVIGLPIKAGGETMGVLYVDNRLQECAFATEDSELVELFAAQAAIAILNARRVAELREHNQGLEHSRRQIEALNDQLGRKVRDRDSELAVVRAELGRERGRYDYTSMVGASDGMREVFQQLDRIIETEMPVLIQGESGTGKELIARAIHYNGPRKERAFVCENCAALPDTLLESELFGHSRGAFTGAHRAKKGLFEQADGGTLFLDEIGDMSIEMQKKLLRALQEGEFRPLGSEHVVHTDVRLLAASHQDLEQLVSDGAFREDLFYRINVLTVSLPPLRERRDDIPLLAEHLLARAAREAGRPAPSLSHAVMAALVAHDWPGNVRELENEMRRLVVLARGDVHPDQLSKSVCEARVAELPLEVQVMLDHPGDIKAAVADLERRSIEAAMDKAGGNKSRAGSALGISRFALQRKLEKYGIGSAAQVEQDPLCEGEGEGDDSAGADIAAEA
jgi:transcriptional regulator with GAF, ATPase, and Fis domain